MNFVEFIKKVIVQNKLVRRVVSLKCFMLWFIFTQILTNALQAQTTATLKPPALIQSVPLHVHAMKVTAVTA